MRVIVVILAGAMMSACMGGSLGDSTTSSSGGRLFSRGSDVTAVVQQRSPAAAQMINEYRARHGLGPVSEDPRLMRAAAAHASDLAAAERVSHYGSDGSDPAGRVKRAGYTFSNIGENVSAGRASLTEVIQAWIDSGPHRRNLELSPATHFGLAHSFSPESHYRHYWVLVLAEPAGAPSSTQSGVSTDMSISIGGSSRR